MVKIEGIQLSVDESLNFQFEEIGHCVADFLQKEVAPTSPGSEPAYPIEVARAIAGVESACMQAAYAVYLYYSRKSREELREVDFNNPSNPA